MYNHHGSELVGTWDPLLGIELSHTMFLTVSIFTRLFSTLLLFEHDPSDTCGLQEAQTKPRIDPLKIWISKNFYQDCKGFWAVLKPLQYLEI